MFRSQCFHINEADSTTFMLNEQCQTRKKFSKTRKEKFTSKFHLSWLLDYDFAYVYFYLSN